MYFLKIFELIPKSDYTIFILFTLRVKSQVHLCPYDDDVLTNGRVPWKIAARANVSYKNIYQFNF